MANHIKTPTRIPIQDPKCEFLQQFAPEPAKDNGKMPYFPAEAQGASSCEKWLRLVLNFSAIHVDIVWRTILILKIVFSSTSRT